MRNVDLNETLTAYLEAFDVEVDDALEIESAELTAPLNVKLVVRNGQLNVEALPPYSVYKSGFEPVYQRMTVSVKQVKTMELEIRENQ